MKEETLACTLWRTRCGRSCGPIIRHSRQWMNSCATWHSLSSITLLTRLHTQGRSRAPIQLFHRSVLQLPQPEDCAWGDMAPLCTVNSHVAQRYCEEGILRNIIASTDIIPARVNCDKLCEARQSNWYQIDTPLNCNAILTSLYNHVAYCEHLSINTRNADTGNFFCPDHFGPLP